MRYNHTERLPQKSQIGKPITRNSMQIQIRHSCATEETHNRTTYMKSRIMTLEVHEMIAGVYIEQTPLFSMKHPKFPLIGASIPLPSRIKPRRVGESFERRTIGNIDHWYNRDALTLLYCTYSPARS